MYLFTSRIKDRNFITPNIVDYYQANHFIVELSTGVFIKQRYYGVTVCNAHTGKHELDLGKCFETKEQALEYIEEL
jgi:hypothetical protein